MRKIIVFVLAVAAAAAAGAAPMTPAGTPQTAIFAGGCFWSMQSAFEKVYGVIDAVSGYTGGTSRRPNYDNYAASGHVEAVQVSWDPNRVSATRSCWTPTGTTPTPPMPAGSSWTAGRSTGPSCSS